MPAGKELDKVVREAIVDVAREIHGTILTDRKPTLRFPIRSLKNVKYDPEVGYLEILGQEAERTLTVNTVKPFAQTLRMMALSKLMVDMDEHATKRDAYYQSKNWGDARFDEQPESDTVMDDIEAMFAVRGVTREQLRYVPDEHGGAVAGELVVIDRDRETGEKIEIDCTRFGSGAYTVPVDVEHLKFRTKAKFVLAIETGGVFDRLNRHKYWQKANCILVAMGGVPTRACRRFIRRLSEENKLAVYAFVDGDPYGIANIYRTLKVGSGNAAHINRFFCVPNARFLGVMPQDIIDYDLQKATHPLKDVDIKRAKDALKNDPFFIEHKRWKQALNQMIEMGVRVEQQAFALHSLNYVTEEYLPRKVADPKKFLP
ncbi:MAG: DNA topoisomerase IV subunit A [Planctomycetes bacterium]|nr:DNA topoisomerase IV subunit A [Planctomycetota bacterium]